MNKYGLDTTGPLDPNSVLEVEKAKRLERETELDLQALGIHLVPIDKAYPTVKLSSPGRELVAQVDTDDAEVPEDQQPDPESR